VQNSDCLISLGTGLNIHKVGFNVAGFAPKAKRVIVDIDKGQLDFQKVRPDVPILADVREFLTEFLSQLKATPIKASSRWLEACSNWKRRYPIIVDDFLKDKEHVNSYVFMDKLSDATLASDIVVTGNGLDTVSFCQAFKVKKGQRAMTTGWGSMGWDLPLAIGTCISRGRARTVCVTGDGSFQWNVQELLTIRRYDLPVKIFVFNNHGYSTIRATQNNFFDGRFVGSDFKSGVANPDFCKLADAYGFSYGYIRNHDDLEAGIHSALATEGPVLWEVNISPEQGVSPKASAFRRADGTFESRPLEDMEPFLPREEIFENMHLFDEPAMAGASNSEDARRS
jgi:acetolactate synthase-1/2/3 large subunit